jgi:tetratricopeptide (TPR) repeat protein
MTSPPARSAAVFAVVMAALLSASVALQLARDRATPASHGTARYLYLQSGSALTYLTVAYQTLAADVYWIRAIQHYGNDRLSKGGTGRYELLYPLLDITTTLDPRFTIAYRFGAIFLAEEPPGGPGRPDLAIALLRKGLRAEPRKWQYAEDAGFIYYWQAREPVTAAHWFERASAIPGAPNWLVPLAATMLVQGGDRRSSRFLWQQLRATADQDWLRNLADLRLSQLQAMDQIDRLQQLVTDYERTAPPARLTWQRLYQAGAVRGVPVDPAGTPYDLDPVRGTVTLSRTSPLFPLPAEPAATRAPTS